MTVPIPNHADSLESESGPVPRDGHLYNIDDEALEFMKSQTGIQDSKALKDLSHCEGRRRRQGRCTPPGDGRRLVHRHQRGEPDIALGKCV